MEADKQKIRNPGDELFDKFITRMLSHTTSNYRRIVLSPTINATKLVPNKLFFVFFLVCKAALLAGPVIYLELSGTGSRKDYIDHVSSTSPNLVDSGRNSSIRTWGQRFATCTARRVMVCRGFTSLTGCRCILAGRRRKSN